MTSLFSHLWIFLTHVYNFKYVFNSTVIKLSWHILCYLISKNLYLLKNAQPFIFQLICMQSCKCIYYFLKLYNKKLNQYCLNFIIFLPKIFFLNGSGRVAGRVESGWPAKNMGRITGQPVFALGQKNRVRIRYFSSRVRSGPKIMTRFVMSAKLSRFIRFGIISTGNGIAISLVIDGFSQLISHTTGLKTQLRQTKTNATLHVGKGLIVKTLFYQQKRNKISGTVV